MGRKEQTEHVTLELLHTLALSMTAACLSANCVSSAPHVALVSDKSVFQNIVLGPEHVQVELCEETYHEYNIYMCVTLMHGAAFSMELMSMVVGRSHYLIEVGS